MLLCVVTSVVLHLTFLQKVVGSYSGLPLVSGGIDYAVSLLIHTCGIFGREAYV